VAIHHDARPHAVFVCNVSWCWPRLTETSLIVKRTNTHSALCECHKAEMLCGSSKWKYFPNINSNFSADLRLRFEDKTQAIFCCPALALFQLEQPMTNSLVTQHNCGEWWRLFPTLAGWDGSGGRYPTDVCDMWVTILLVTNWTGQAIPKNTLEWVYFSHWALNFLPFCRSTSNNKQVFTLFYILLE